MAKQNAIILYEDAPKNAVLSGGSYEVALPLSNLLDSDLKKPARTTDLNLSSTQFNVAFDATYYARAIVIGPSNLYPLFQYRIRLYDDAGFTITTEDTGFIQPATNYDSPTSFHWGEDDFWLKNDHLGGYIIHIFPDVVASQYWSIEIDDQLNPDGYLDLGHLFMPLGWQPSLSFADGVTFGIRNNALVSSTLSGGKKFWRRVNPRFLRFALPILPKSEGYGQAYRFMQSVGFNEMVFVIPEPDDVSSINTRSFFGTVTEMDPLTQSVVGRVGAGFQVEEII